jgi:hypothetical protein
MVPIIPLLRFIEDPNIQVTRSQALNWIGLSFSREDETFKIIGVDSKPPKHKEGLYIVYKTDGGGVQYMKLNEATEPIIPSALVPLQSASN